MANRSEAKKVILSLIKLIPETSLKKAASKLSVTSSVKTDSINLDDLFLTNDPQVSKIVEVFNLRNPKNMIKFLVEGYFAQIESISKSICNLHERDLKQSIAKISGCQDTFLLAMDNPSRKAEFLTPLMNKLNEKFRQMEQEMESSISEIQKIDGYNDVKFFWTTFNNIQVLKTDVRCVKEALYAAILTVNLRVAISTELGYNIERSVNEIYNKFKNNLLNSDAVAFLKAYDEKKNKVFWDNIPAFLNEAAVSSKAIDTYISNSDEFDYDNIEFN